MDKTRWLMTATLLGAMVLGGCDGFGGSSSTKNNLNSTSADDATANAATITGTNLIPAPRPPVPDLPVAIGFKMNESISRNYESAGARFIDHTYEGQADKFDVERFYRQQMPLKGWTMRGSQMVRGDFLMRFEKGSELCEVGISSEKTFRGERTTVNFNVQTLGRGEPSVYRESRSK
jgi:hypothetical protein